MKLQTYFNKLSSHFLKMRGCKIKMNPHFGKMRGWIVEMRCQLNQPSCLFVRNERGYMKYSTLVTN